jgi:hypothetical protein
MNAFVCVVLGSAAALALAGIAAFLARRWRRLTASLDLVHSKMKQQLDALAQRLDRLESHDAGRQPAGEPQDDDSDRELLASLLDLNETLRMPLRAANLGTTNCGAGEAGCAPPEAGR